MTISKDQREKNKLIGQILNALNIQAPAAKTIIPSWIQCLNKYDYKTLTDMLTLALIASRNKKPEVKK